MADPLIAYSPRILIDFFLSSTIHLSTEDTYVTEDTTTTLYEGRLKDSPQLEKELANAYWGLEIINSITLEYDNSDGYFTILAATDEFRHKRKKIRRYEPNETNFSDKLLFELQGVVTEYNLLDIASFTISLFDPDPLQTLLPQKVYETDDWV